MIPIKLEIEGLYSYKEKQSIDFTQLTGAGLFGIFGAVGSGKSSVLEAILLALYGNTERLASKGEKNSMVNLQSQAISINLEFKAGKNNQQLYKASYLAKRNPKKFEDIKPATHTFYEQQNGSWMPLEMGAEQILGMKMSHFRQTVIIPQGKFREFIEQKPKDRADMMKELFGLERFDLADRTRRLLSAEREKKTILNTKLEGLDTYTKEVLQQSLEHQQSLSDQRESQSKLVDQKEQELRKGQSIKEKAGQLKQLLVQWQSLEEKIPVFQQKREHLEQYQKALTYLKPILEQIKEQETEEEKYRVSVVDCERFQSTLEQEIEQKEARYNKLYTEYRKKGEREARIRDLLQIKNLNQLGLEKQSLQEELHRLTKNSQEFQSKKTEMEKAIQEQEQKLDNLKVPSMEEISKMEAALVEMRQNAGNLQSLERQLNSLEENLALSENEVKSLLTELHINHTDFGTLLQESNTQLSLLEKEREKLLQQQGLFTYANQLQAGEACPLCGALDHPTPLSHNFDQEKLSNNELQIQKKKTKLEQYRQAQSKHEKLLIGQQNAQANKAEKLTEIQKLKERNQTLIQQFGVLGLKDQEAIENRLVSAKHEIQTEKELSSGLKKLQTNHRQFLTEAEKDLEKLQAIDHKAKTLDTKIETKLAEINYQDLLEKYQSTSAQKIDEDISKVKTFLDELEVNLPRAQDALNEAKQKQTTNLTNLKNYQNRLEEVKGKLIKLKDELALSLESHAFKDATTVKQLLASQIDPKQLEEEIKEFDRQRDLFKVKIQELKADQAVMEFSIESFEKMQEEYKIAKNTLHEIQESLSLLTNKIGEIKLKLDEKSQLKKSLQEVENRESNLNELNRMFQGSGFVKYVSNIYLKELVQTANLRFMKLSKNSLSLDVDESNTFWIIDHLNGGNRRLLKSLSGGQTFQASLCLALALAEKVKSLNRAEQSFFFLDEGFGALDKNALRTVFETLKSLRHENRIVGIISHVEELQQEIGVFAKVALDTEKGSQVSYSY
ncbi:SMC family ATPase [Echinicola marina]|uniref:SbcC/MukB-like Walker B domain-containing protein n=1 Tax=Echinicola marina TaxID=2859768 RepID=UPI001CF6D1F4|nr:SMC family ATPase [Echinicola marina]UCS95022.1 SMC family ATPase [Echinicola marina]